MKEKRRNVAVVRYEKERRRKINQWIKPNITQSSCSDYVIFNDDKTHRSLSHTSTYTEFAVFSPSLRLGEAAGVERTSRQTGCGVNSGGVAPSLGVGRGLRTPHQ